MLIGSLIVPLGLPLRAERPQGEEPHPSGKPRKPPALKLGELPLARGDVEGLRQALMTQRRLRDLSAQPRVQRSLVFRGSFKDALTWMEIHGHAPEVVEHWRGVQAGIAAERAAAGHEPRDGEEPGDNAGNLAQPQSDQPPGRRRRRRRRRRRPPV